MCGIVGILSQQNVTDRLIEGLKRLEYRGYDSAGVATIDDNVLSRRRAPGKLKELENICKERPLSGNIGIGHTRWATHGIANKENAHPHMSDHVAVVHNGIIENFAELKEDLQQRYAFQSETDTEVVVYLLEDEIKAGHTPLKALQNIVKKIKGAYALAILFKNHPETLYGVRHGSPLVVGMSEEHGAMLGSDAISLAPWARKLCYLQDGDMVELRLDQLSFFDKDEVAVDRPFVQNYVSADTIGKGEYRHYMLKEIFEQPAIIGQLLNHVLAADSDHITLPTLDFDFSTIDRISIIACGTSYYSGMVAEYWFEKMAGIAVDVDIASEFRYRSPVFSKNHLCVFISQSGETIDTLAALDLCKKQGAKTLAIVNVPQSSIARMADHVIFTHAGPEIGVASTKAFTCQMLCLLSLALSAARQQKRLTAEDEKSIIGGLRTLPGMMNHVLGDDAIKGLSEKLTSAEHVIFLGRGIEYPLALEAALKLKEITYIPAHAYAAGELKHGPIATIDPDVPVLVLAPHDAWFEKTMGNIQEVLARRGNVIIFTDSPGFDHISGVFKDRFKMGENIIVCPEIHNDLKPFLFILPLQLLAYHTAVKIGTDVDQPRNLAKSVTVE